MNNLTPLGEIAEKVTVGHVGSTSKYYCENGIPFLRTQNVRKGEIDATELKHITPDFHLKLKKSTIRHGDVLVSRVISNEIRCGIVPASLDGANCANIILVRPGKNLYAPYLKHLIGSPGTQRVLMSRKVGSAQSVVNTTTLKSWKIPLLPLAEQKRIAGILDKADAIRRKRQAAIKLADDFLRAAFLDMFGDPVMNPKGWERKGLNDVGILARGKSKHRPRNDPKLLGGPYPLIQTGEVANSNNYITQYNRTYSELGLKQSKLWPAETLCITIAANIADTAILTFDACFPDSVVGFTPNDLVKTEYIHMWLTFYQKIIREKAPESAQKNINLKILSELRIPIPPIEKQKIFVACFERIENLKKKLRGSEGKSNECFNSLTQRAFRGEL